MAWPARTWIAGELATAALGNAYWRDPQVDIRAGGLAFAQAQHFIFASSSTQLGHIDAQTNKIPRYNGEIGTWEMVHPLELAWPVGSIYRASMSTNPTTLLGFGTWTAFGAGRCTVAFDAGDINFDTVRKTGGEQTVAISIGDMPVHTHVQDSHNHTQNSHNHTQDPHDHSLSNIGATNSNANEVPDLTTVSDNTGSLTSNSVTATNNPTTAVNQSTTAINQTSGSGFAHNNLMPYIVSFVWERIA